MRSIEVAAGLYVSKMIVLIIVLCGLSLATALAATREFNARSKISNARNGACCMTCGGHQACITCQKGQVCRRSCAHSIIDFTRTFRPGPVVACFGEPTR